MLTNIKIYYIPFLYNKIWKWVYIILTTFVKIHYKNGKMDVIIKYTLKYTIKMVKIK